MNLITSRGRLLMLLSLLLALSCAERSVKPSSAILTSEFVYEQASFPSAHASTMVETGDAVAAAWFGGTAEGESDVGIWLSRNEGAGWSAPEEVAHGLQPDGSRYPCWNPVLFQPAKGPLLLFYKVGPNPRQWWGMVKTSCDSGKTWSAAMRLPQGILGPIRAKPVELADGTLLSGSSTEHEGWVVHMERYAGGADAWEHESLASPDAWTKTGPLNDVTEFGAIQPTILLHSDKIVQILCRSQQCVITEVWSEDGGQSWGPMTATALPNPNAGIDVTRLRDGRWLLIYNPVKEGREQLALAISSDGKEWHQVLMLEDSPGEYSYPAQIQTRDGLVHISYTWRRQRIKHVVVDPALLK